MVETVKEKRQRSEDRFVDLVSKWQNEEKASDRKRDAAQFDFLNKPGQVNRLREESRDAAVNEWESIDLQTQVRSVIS